MQSISPSNSANLRLLSQQAVDDTITDVDSILSSLAMLLQSTLDTRQLLQLFHQQLYKLIGNDGIRLQNPDRQLDIRIGNQARHSCHYQLEIDAQSLGKLSIVRSQRLSETDILLIEEALCKVVYPLRNCLQYQDALASAMTDKLTGMPNRQAFDQHLDREIDLARRLQLPLTLVVIDVDHFKSINDAYGHNSGDRALTLIGQTLASCLRRSDIAFRYGGEEFAVILSHSDAEKSIAVADRLRQNISELTCHDGLRSFSMTISIGLAQMTSEENTFQLFDRADRALYHAKAQGRNQVVNAADIAGF
ncbi:response regulator [Methylophaga frappieri]|uniref:diguanylate cyclase n=1 Tax=Methylophaga frappieri (strain ATCC BAA-2434 / DSM 25690 / JAM7) TaxID=754477 RepID=I1YK56_METFJ|nr:GGDEF domain-containing protein [Methylophaga frappieri]AFJ03299.1 response regulator [Methylophaga frappieri]